MNATLVNNNDLALTDGARLDALAQTGLMGSAPEPVFDRLVALASQLLGAPVALMSLVGEDHQFFKAESGLADAGVNTRVLPLPYSFCRHVVNSGEQLVVTDAPNDGRVNDNLSIEEMGVRAYLGVPLTTADGHTFGSLCVLDTETRDWSDANINILSDLASAVQSEISLRLALRDAERVAEERDLLMGEMNHRVKNLFTMVSGMVGVTARGSLTPDAMATSLRGRINALATAHDLVRPAISGGVGDEGGTNLHEIATIILAPHDRIGTIHIEGHSFMLDAQSGARLSLVLHELATNAAKYGGLSETGGALALTWTLGETHLDIDWTETLPPKAGKQSAIVAEPTAQTEVPSGFGARLIDGAVISQMGGTIEREWKDSGLHVQISLPRARVENC